MEIPIIKMVKSKRPLKPKTQKSKRHENKIIIHNFIMSEDLTTIDEIRITINPQENVRRNEEDCNK